jgi:hypothetical protein
MYVQPMMPTRPPLAVVKLSDYFGQYVLTLQCACGHTRIAKPKTLAAMQDGTRRWMLVKANAMLALWGAPVHGDSATGNQARWVKCPCNNPLH